MYLSSDSRVCDGNKVKIVINEVIEPREGKLKSISFFTAENITEVINSEVIIYIFSPRNKLVELDLWSISNISFP